MTIPDGVNIVIMNRLPVRSAVTQNEDGSHTIFLSSSLSYHQQRKCFIHELGHILNMDFDKADVNEIEANAHGWNYGT